ncbi:MAG TPA: hypothetical protein VMS17_33170 [Gemmataceae bacterium]|nr:hypothetical protein [Gemmataceae bacterium]
MGDSPCAWRTYSGVAAGEALTTICQYRPDAADPDAEVRSLASVLKFLTDNG